MDLQKKANQIRKNVVDVAVRNGCGHIASSLSCVDILVALYYQVMTPDDHFVLSKSHGCYGLYAILADLGKLPRDVWENFQLLGCVERKPEWGLEVSTGSLGHGLPIAVGMAWAMKLQEKPGRVYCVVGDGEMQEGSMWETMNFAENNGLDNLTTIIDDNRLQAMGNSPESFTRFDGSVRSWTMGHNMECILDTFRINLDGSRRLGKPGIIIANTIKGYGLKCMEDVARFHFRVPTEKELQEGNRYE